MTAASKTIPKNIRVLDQHGREWSMKGTEWIETDLGMVTVWRNEEQVASFESPAWVISEDQVVDEGIGRAPVAYEVGERPDD